MLDLLFPGRRLAFDSALSLEEVTRRLQQEIAAPALPIFDRRTQTFQGRFADGRFWMKRIVKGRNSFNPLIEGELSRVAGGTRVEARLQLHPLVLALLAIFTLVASQIAAIAAPEFLPVPGAGLAGGVAATLLIVGLCLAMSNVEARKTLKLLSGIFGAPPTQPRVTASPG
jgi:hypothetical protein